jgi:divalent metal cation (Fe/Co/Zn/Cd) transporter
MYWWLEPVLVSLVLLVILSAVLRIVRESL